MTDRSTIYLKCPGSLGTAVVVAEFPATVFGVGNPANTGDYPLSISAIDKKGKLVNSRNSLVLNPGQSAGWYYPPSKTHRIVAAGFKGYVGGTALEYDTPDA